MSLESRINRIADLLDGPARDVWIFVHGHIGDFADVPGSIEPWPNGRGVNMIVPAEHGADPIRGLSEEQRASLRPGDRVEAHAWEDDGDSLFMDERNYIWKGKS